MSTSPEKRIDDALRILARYQRELAQRMAEEIIEGKDDFATPFLGSAEAIINKYYHLLGSMCPIISTLEVYSPTVQAGKRAALESKQDSRVLSPAQFRCFRCREIISSNADSCPYCGWTWKKDSV
jgi:hypothetical protein